MDIELGDRARDLVSGFTGIVTSKTIYLNGCIRYGLTPEATKDGRPIDAVWFDENELTVDAKAAAGWGLAKKKVPVHGPRGGDPAGR